MLPSRSLSSATILDQSTGELYKLACDWPPSVFLQGASPLDMPAVGWRMAFIEAFPEGVSGMFRVEAESLADAELMCWAKYQLSLACTHVWDRGGWRNGCATCKTCGLFGVDILVPLEHCCICGVPTYFSRNEVTGSWYCSDHLCLIPWDELSDFERDKQIANPDRRDIAQVVKLVNYLPGLLERTRGASGHIIWGRVVEHGQWQWAIPPDGSMHDIIARLSIWRLSSGHYQLNVPGDTAQRFCCTPAALESLLVILVDASGEHRRLTEREVGGLHFLDVSSIAAPAEGSK